MLTNYFFCFKNGYGLAMAVAVIISLSGLGVAQDLTGIKCIVHGTAAATAESSVEYREGNVFFCCDNCAEKFREAMNDENSDLLIKANHQLLLTRQYVQTACPLTGRPVAADKTEIIGGVEVGLCCGGCQSKLQSATELLDQAKMVFSKAAFEKGFAKKPEPKLEGVNCFLMPKKELKEEFSVEYGNHRIFFCCRSCLNRFTKDSTAHLAKANHQLARTSQVRQTACPISGGEVDKTQTAEVGGVSVAFCCGNCKAKVEQAEGDDKVNLVFGQDNFAKAFK